MLIIVESPAKAKTISKIVGSKYEVKASVGHIRRISDAKKSKDGNTYEINGIDIEHGFTPIYEVDEAKKKVVSEIKQLAKKHDKIYFATDFDREGEAISWHLADVLGIKAKDYEKIERLEFHEITSKAINEALANPKKLRMSLVVAQKARQVLDKLVGYKVSPLLWKVLAKNNLSAGRVQSPALKLVVDREKEITNFKPEIFWQAKGLFGSNVTTVLKTDYNQQNPSLKEKSDTLITENNLDYLYLSLDSYKNQAVDKIKDKKILDQVLKNISDNLKYSVSDYKTKNLNISPKAPFITSTIQQSASSNLGYNPKKTMMLAQKLYEGIEIDGTPTALITYMRTDSTNLSADAIDDIRQLIKNEYSEALPDKPINYSKKSKNAQEAHEAIRPISVKLHPEELKSKLDSDLYNLYKLIWKQTVACQMSPETKEIVNIKVKNVDNFTFNGTVSWTIKPGYKLLYPEQITTRPKNLDVKQDQEFWLDTFELYQKSTQPPARFSQASLIKELESLGIGRPSTYASIITTLYDREYVANAEGSKTSITPTNLGIKTIEVLEKYLPDLISSSLTARMEDKLDQIANTEYSKVEDQYQETMNFFWTPLKTEVEKVTGGQSKVDFGSFRATKTDQKCPICNSEMELKMGRFGDYLQCLGNVDHKFKANFKEIEVALAQAKIDFSNQVIGHKCTECGKDLVVRVSASTLNPYIACPDYKVGNKHTVMAVNYGACPECLKHGRDGLLIKKKAFRGSSYIGCSLAKEVCGYIQKKQTIEEPVIKQ
jgi:DNA topoisomerase I